MKNVDNILNKAQADLKRLLGADVLINLEVNRATLTNVVIQVVSETLDIRSTDIVSKVRTREFVEARQIAMFILTNDFKMQYKETGRFFNMNHTSVIHANRQIKNLLSVHDKSITYKLQKIKQALQKHNL